MQCVRDLQIWVRADCTLHAAVTNFSPQSFTVHVEGSSDSFSQDVTVYSSGSMSGSSVDTVNSFAQFSNQVQQSGTCNLRLLPQVLHVIPRGLRIKIYTNQIQATASTGIDTQHSDSVVWKSRVLNFTPGYNFQPSITNGDLVLSAGAGLGTGTPTALQLKQLIASDSTEQAHPAEYYGGVININGQTRQITFDTSASVYMKLQTSMAASEVLQTIDLCLKKEILE